MIANAAETIGKNPSCNSQSCLGVWDGLLADCPHEKNILKEGGAGCVSSQDDTPGIFAVPLPSASGRIAEEDSAYKWINSFLHCKQPQSNIMEIPLRFYTKKDDIFMHYL